MIQCVPPVRLRQWRWMFHVLADPGKRLARIIRFVGDQRGKSTASLQSWQCFQDFKASMHHISLLHIIIPSPSSLYIHPSMISTQRQQLVLHVSYLNHDLDI
jgi:hypothetical protein